MNALKEKSLTLAANLLRAGRPINFVKSITGITLAERLWQKWDYDVIVPDPKGWTGGDPLTGEGAIHNGHMLHTGAYRSVFPTPEQAKGKSNNQMKREDRKGFFDKLRAERKQRLKIAAQPLCLRRTLA